MQSSDRSTGIIYIATGKQHVREARESAQRLRHVLQANDRNLPITIFSDGQIDIKEESNITEKWIDSRDFTNSRSNKKVMLSKVSFMYDSPYERTLFFDTDTYVCDDFTEIFDLLDRFDLAVAHAPGRMNKPVDGVPESFPQMNTGVILFKKSPQMLDFFTQWLSLYEKDLTKADNERPKGYDQSSLRVALYKSDLRVATLTPEYNCRFRFPTFVRGTVKILHARVEKGESFTLSGICEKINSEQDKRAILINTQTSKVNLLL